MSQSKLAFELLSRYSHLQTDINPCLLIGNEHTLEHTLIEASHPVSEIRDGHGVLRCTLASAKDAPTIKGFGRLGGGCMDGVREGLRFHLSHTT